MVHFRFEHMAVIQVVKKLTSFVWKPRGLTFCSQKSYCKSYSAPVQPNPKPSVLFLYDLV